MKPVTPTKFLLSYIFILGTFLSSAQWSQVEGLKGGYFFDVVQVESGTKYLAASKYGGVYKTTDNGLTWTLTDGDLIGIEIRSITTDGSTVIIGTINGIYRSADEGGNWTLSNSGLTETDVLSVISSDTETFLAGTSNGIFVSMNDGASWSSSNTGIPADTEINDLELEGFPDYNDLTAATSNGLYESTDGGVNWSQVTVTGAPAQEFNDVKYGSDDFGDLRMKYAVHQQGTDDVFVYYTENGGTSYSWGTLPGLEGLTIYELDFFPGGPPWILPMTSDGIYSFTFDPENLAWEPYTLGNTVGTRVFSFLPGSKHYMTAEDGVFINETGDWEEKNNGIYAHSISSLLEIDNKIYAGTKGNGVLISDDKGATWTPSNTNLEGPNLDINTIVSDGEYIYIGTAAGVWRSSNGGDTWGSVNTGLNEAPVTHLAFYGPQLLALSEGHGIYHTTDDGANWQARGSGIDGTVISLGESTFGVNAGTSGGSALLYNYDGNTWFAGGSGITNSGSNKVSATFKGSKLFAATDEGLFVEETPNNWVAAGSLPGVPGHFVEFDNAMYVSIDGHGIYQSVDDGANWTAFNEDLTTVKTGPLLYSQKLLFAGTQGSGIWVEGFSGGSGTLEKPWQITTVEQLNNIRDHLDNHFILMNDLDLSTVTGDETGQYWNDGAGWEPIGKYSSIASLREPFTGTFNGNGFTISGLSINRPETDYVGLFGFMDYNNILNQHPEISDLTLSSVNITGFDRTGALAGSTSANNGSITNCSSSGMVTGNSYTGGLIGISSSDIENCYSTCNVTGVNRVGGLIGDSDGQIHLSYATGSVTGNGFLGGLVGNSTSYTFNSYATGDVTGQWNYIGGLLGYGTSSSGVSYCYATGTTTVGGFYTEGLIGYNDGSLISGFFDIGACTSAGFVSRGVGLTTDQMSQESSFSNWNFTDNWAIDEGNSYPYLQWQGEAEAHNIPPEIAAPIPDITTLDDLTGECAVSMPAAPTATDNCSRTIEGVPDLEFPINTPGTTEITWTYDDGNNNISTQTQNVVIADVTAPVPDAESLDDVTGQCSVGMPVAPTATDNCDGEVTGTTDLEFPVTAQGTTEITWTFEDAAGNTSTQTQNVVVEDITDPVPNLAELPDIVGECDGSVSMPEAPLANDNCDGQITATTSTVFPIAEIGTTEITWTYEDASGNTFVQMQNVIIGQSYETSVEEDLCESSSFTFPDGTIWDGETLSQMSVLQSQQGCDSMVTTNITILPAPSVDLGPEELWACDGEELSIDLESTTGIESYTITSVAGVATDGPLEFTFTTSLNNFEVRVVATGVDGCEAEDVLTLKDNAMINWGIGLVQNNDPEIVISSSTLPEAADSFEWDFGDGTTNNTEINPTHTYQENGTYTITLTASNECGDESLSTSVTITGVCTVTDNTVSTSENSLMANASGFSYQWIDCNSNLPVDGETSQSFTPTESGNYAVEISDGNCTVESSCFQVEVLQPLGFQPSKFLSIYPNPVSEKILIESGNEQFNFVRVINAAGKEILNVDISKKKEVNVRQLSSGVYFLRVEGDDLTEIIRFIKK
ncbi:MAG: PKD domain-containing protein [Cyclobacteriaceae bacterium]